MVDYVKPKSKNVAIKEAYKDLDLNFMAHPITGDVTTTPPTGFEICLDNSSWVTSPIVIPQADAESGDVVYVRMAAGASSPTTADLSISGGGLPSALTTSLSGTITTTPNAGTLSGNTAQNIGSQVQFTTDGDAGGTWSSDNASAADVNSSSNRHPPAPAAMAHLAS